MGMNEVASIDVGTSVQKIYWCNRLVDYLNKLGNSQTLIARSPNI